MTSWIESIDVNAYVQQLMQQETTQINKVTQNKLNQLNTSETALKAKVSSYGQLQSLLSTLQQKIQNLTTSFNPSFQVSSSNSNVATVAINDTVSPGNHTLTVTQLAQSEQVASANTYSSNNAALGMTNTLTISVGSSNFNINIGTGDSLQTIANNINTAASVNNVGAFASVVSTGTNQYRLIISSTQTGTANAVNISETGTGSNALKISTGAGGTGTILSQAQDANFTLDTLNYVTSTNTNSIAGLNINILSLGSSTLSVTQTDSVSNVNQAIQDTVDSYNAIMKFVAQTQISSTLPDSILSSIQSTLTNIMSNSTVLMNLGITPTAYDKIDPITGTTANGDPISIHPAGLLSITADPVTGETLATKLAANFSSIQSQLVGTSGVLTQVNNMLNQSTGSVWKILNDTQNGAITLTNNQINSLDDQISNINSDATNQKNNLIMKYAKLDLLLSNLQAQAQYISQQLLVMNNSSSGK